VFRMDPGVDKMGTFSATIAGRHGDDTHGVRIFAVRCLGSQCIVMTPEYADSLAIEVIS